MEGICENFSHDNFKAKAESIKEILFTILPVFDILMVKNKKNMYFLKIVNFPIMDYID